MNLYKSLIRPILFLLEPETAQKFSEFALKRKLIWKISKNLFEYDSELLETNLAGIHLTNPIGLAAGFDKDCQLLSSLETFGFGYLTGGTITREARPGNAQPRMLRLNSQNGLINSLGFPGSGLQSAIKRLSKLPSVSKDSSKRILSISGTTEDDILYCYSAIEKFSSGIEINISSPNTAGLRIFQQPKNFRSLIEHVNEKRASPIIIKLPPFNAQLDDSDTNSILELINICVDLDVDAVTAGNTHPVQDNRLAVGSGGLSGATIFDNTLAMVKKINKEFGSKIAINSCGGVSTGRQTHQLLRNGATTVQLYTSMVYEGPGLIKKIKKDLVEEFLLESQ